MGARTKNQIVLKKQKCGGFLFKIFEPKMSIRSTNIALAGNGSHIGAVGDLEHKTSNYRYTSLDALPFNLPLKPLLLQYAVMLSLRIFSSKLQSEQGFLFFFFGMEKIFLLNSL